MNWNRAKHLKAAGGVVGVVVMAAVLPSTVGATKGDGELRLNGGDKLMSYAWHCGTYFRHCSWQTSAKLVGSHPRRARWIAVNTEVRAHGPSAKITIGKSTNVEITFKSSTLVRTRWVNRKHWISWSSGRVGPSLSTAYVSTRASASAYHRIFGRPHGVIAYAGMY